MFTSHLCCVHDDMSACPLYSLLHVHHLLIDYNLHYVGELQQISLPPLFIYFYYYHAAHLLFMIIIFVTNFGRDCLFFPL